MAVAYPFCGQCEKPDKRMSKIQSSRFLHIYFNSLKGIRDMKGKKLKTKKFLSLLMFLLISILSITFTACNSNDDDATKITSPVVGTWKGVYSTSTSGANLIFKSDGTYYLAVTVKGSTSKGQGTFEVSSGNKGIIKIYDEKGNAEDFWEFEMSSDNNKMTTKAMSGSSSIDWIRQ